jgi:hypothetical protein
MFRAAPIMKPTRCFIKYQFCPPCITCKYILIDRVEPLNTMKTKCTKFAVCNKITGTIEYENAIDCRDDLNKCGNIGFYYENKRLGP